MYVTACDELGIGAHDFAPKRVRNMHVHGILTTGIMNRIALKAT